MVLSHAGTGIRQQKLQSVPQGILKGQHTRLLLSHSHTSSSPKGAGSRWETLPTATPEIWRPYTWLQLLPNCQQVSSPVDTGAQQETLPAASSEIPNGLPRCSSSLTAAVCQQTSQPSNPVRDTSVCTPGGPETASCLTLPPPSLSPGVVLLAQGTGGRYSCLYLWESLKRPSTQF